MDATRDSRNTVILYNVATILSREPLRIGHRHATGNVF